MQSLDHHTSLNAATRYPYGRRRRWEPATASARPVLCFPKAPTLGQQAGVACRLPLGWHSPPLLTLITLSRAVLGSLCGRSLVRSRPRVGRQAFARLHIIFLVP